MPHNSNFSLNSINLAIDFFFRVCLPLYESRNVSKKKLRSPAKTTCLSDKSLKVSKILSTSTLLFPIYPIATPQELVLACEKKILVGIHENFCFYLSVLHHILKTRRAIVKLGKVQVKLRLSLKMV